MAKRRRIGRFLLWAPVYGALLFVVWTTGLLLANRHEHIYQFGRWVTDARAVTKGGAVREVVAADGTPLAVWVHPPDPGRPMVLHFGGNVGVLSRAVDRVLPLVRRGYGAAVMAYRGSSSMPGAPSEEAIVADAVAVYDALMAEGGMAPGIDAAAGPPVAYGASLGAAVAVQLAARREVSALVLVAPFARLCSTAEHHYPWVPACLVMWDEHWDSAAHIPEVEAPILILHGGRDGIIPLSEAEALAEAAGPGARFVVYPAAGHDDLGRHGATDEVIDFLDRL